MRPLLGRVLVVEDEFPVAATLHDMLVELGYRVKIAVTGEEAFGLVPIYRPDVFYSISTCLGSRETKSSNGSIEISQPSR